MCVVCRCVMHGLFMSTVVKHCLSVVIVSAARSLTCRDDLDSKWWLLLAENEYICVCD